jgi:hypothetical protein
LWQAERDSQEAQNQHPQGYDQGAQAEAYGVPFQAGKAR